MSPTLIVVGAGLGALAATLPVIAAAAWLLVWWVRRELEAQLRPLSKRVASVQRTQDYCRECRAAEVRAANG
jgi:hypothetical protein